MRALGLIANVNRWLAYVCGYALLGLAFLIIFEIFARRLFGYSLQGVDELGGYIVAVTGTFSFAYCLIERGHTRIDIVLNRVPGRGRAMLNTLAIVMAAGAALFMTWYGWRALADSIAFNSRSATPLQTPTWIPQSLWFAGLIVFTITALVMALHAAILSMRDPEHTNRDYGPASVEEEVEREMSGAAQRMETSRSTKGVR